MREKRMTVNTDAIRRDLINWFGTSGLAFKEVMLGIIESASPERIIEMALNEGWDLAKYEVT